jgi:putative FmdB family regulatory protein
MPFYEFECAACHSRAEVFARSVTSEVAAPACTTAGCTGSMRRVMSRFARHLTMADQLAEAEAKWGKEVDSVMGPEPDVGRMARRYGDLAKDLPPPPGQG